MDLYRVSAVLLNMATSSGSSVCKYVDSEWPPSTAKSTTESTAGSSLLSVLQCHTPLSCVENESLSLIYRHHWGNVELLRDMEHLISCLYPHYTE